MSTASPISPNCANHPEVFGRVASDPTVSRLVTALAADAPKALAVINNRTPHRSGPRLGGGRRTRPRPPHRLQHRRRPSPKHSVQGGTPIAVVKDALAQLPSDPGYRVGRKVKIRTHVLIEYLTKRDLGYSNGFSLTDTMAAKIAMIPKEVWTPAYDADGKVRDGAWVAELTGLLDLSGWPTGMWVIVRKEPPHPGAQLRFTDTDGLRLTGFVTNTTRGQLPDLELRRRRRARYEDCIRTTKDTGLRSLPLHGFDQNRIWLAAVPLACELTAWTQMLAFNTDPARRWEPKRLRLRLLSITGRIARHARRSHSKLSAHAPHVDLLTAGLGRLAALPVPT